MGFPCHHHQILLTALVTLAAGCAGVSSKKKDKAEEEAAAGAYVQFSFGGISEVTAAGPVEFAFHWQAANTFGHPFVYEVFAANREYKDLNGEYKGEVGLRGVYRYEVDFSQAPGHVGSLIGEVDSSATHFIARDFKPDETYAVQVKASDKKDRLDFNKVVYVLTKERLFTETPLGCLSGEAVSSTEVDVTYEMPAGVDSLKILRSETGEFPDDDTVNEEVEKAETAATAADPQATESGSGTGDDGTGSDEVLPDPWEVAVDIPSDGAAVLSADGRDEELFEGRTYHYKCQYHRRGRVRSGQNVVTVQTLNVAPVAGDNGKITLTTLSGSEIRIDFTPATDNVTPKKDILYQIYISEQANLDDPVSIETNGKALFKEPKTLKKGSYTATGLTEFKTYWFNIVARDRAGNGTTYTMAGKMAYDIPEVTFAAASQSVAEDAGDASVQVTIPYAIDVDVTTAMSWAITSGHADGDLTVEPEDTVVIPAGATSATITAALKSDLLVEADETYRFTLSEPVHALAGQHLSHDLVIENDDADLTVSIEQGASQDDPVSSVPVTFTAVFSNPVDPATFTIGDIRQGGTASGLVWEIENSGDNRTFTLRVTGIGLFGDGVIRPVIDPDQVTDIAGNRNKESSGADDQVTLERIAPDVTVEQAASQADPANTLPLVFDVAFSEPIDPATFTETDITMAGTATTTVTAWTIVNGGDDQNFQIQATAVSAAGTIVPRIAAGAVQDVAGNGNKASTASDNAVAFDANQLSVSIEQAVGQGDPVSVVPVNFTVVFDKPINPATFTSADVTQNGTATGLTWSITNTDGGANMNFTLAATAVVGDGTIIPSVAAGTVSDPAANTNVASLSADNSVTWDITPPTVTINQKAGQADPVNTAPVEFDVVFSEPVNPATISAPDFGESGTADGITWTIVNSGDDQNFTLQATAITSSGSVVPTLADSRVEDTAGNSNEAATCGDCSVTFDNVPLTVTVEQAAGQADPATELPIEFTVTFNKAVDPATFTVADVSQAAGGTAAGITWQLSSADNITWTLRTNAVVADGILKPQIAAGLVEDPAGNTNALSTSADNSVTYTENDQPPVVTLMGTATTVAQGDPLDITWTDTDPNNDATIALYYKSVNTGACTAGTLISAGISEDDETDLFSWDTTGVPDDVYYICAVADDGEHPAVESWSAQVAVYTGSVCIWTGTTDTDFETASNWAGCGGSSPQPTDKVYVSAGPATQPVLANSLTIDRIGSGGSGGGTLIISAGADLTVTSTSASFQSSLTLAGNSAACTTCRVVSASGNLAVISNATLTLQDGITLVVGNNSNVLVGSAAVRGHLVADGGLVQANWPRITTDGAAWRGVTARGLSGNTTSLTLDGLSLLKLDESSASSRALKLGPYLVLSQLDRVAFEHNGVIAVGAGIVELSSCTGATLVNSWNSLQFVQNFAGGFNVSAGGTGCSTIPVITVNGDSGFPGYGDSFETDPNNRITWGP